MREEYVAKTTKELKEIQQDYKIMTALIGILIVISVVICIKGLNQSVELLEKEQQINVLEEIVASLKE